MSEIKCLLTLLRSHPPGARLSGGHSLHETSSVLVETVTKTAKLGGAYSSSSSAASSASASAASVSSVKLTSDASKVVCRGAGLSKAVLGQKNNFTVDCSKAGEGTKNTQCYNTHTKKKTLKNITVKRSSDSQLKLISHQISTLASGNNRHTKFTYVCWSLHVHVQCCVATEYTSTSPSFAIGCSIATTGCS